MGMYLNPLTDSYRQAVQSEIYVDKTGMIAYANRVLGTEQKYICVSRPRRFGKSMTANMLSAYYRTGTDSTGLFANLEISQDPSFQKHMNQYDVLFLNMQNFLSRAQGAAQLADYLQQVVLKELRQAFGSQIDEEETRLSVALEQIYDAGGRGFVFIIDEWDCVFRERKNDSMVQTEYLDFLRDLLKDKSYVKLVYMTGILPIKKYGTHSALNMFDEYSMMDQGELARFTGFTEQEVRQLSDRYDMDFLEVQSWYDGYCLNDGLHVYNPKAVVDAMRRRRLGSYWTGTETYEALKVYMEMNLDGLKDDIVRMLAGEKCRINPRTFQNDMTTFKNKYDVLTLLVHLGYLAYEYQEANHKVYIPNREVSYEFANAVEDAGWEETSRLIEASERLLEATWHQDEEIVAQLIDEAHMDHSSILNYNIENALSCVISLAYFSAKRFYTMIRELPAGYGYADIAFLPRKNCRDKPAMIVELKWDKSGESAIEQIKKKHYTNVLKGYTGEVLLVGINYDRKNKKHECRILKETVPNV